LKVRQPAQRSMRSRSRGMRSPSLASTKPSKSVRAQGRPGID
jgi:hypothetical protein